MNSAYPSGLVASAIEAAIRWYWSPLAQTVYGTGEEFNQLREAGLLEEHCGEFRLSEKGIAFVKHILQTPLPVQRWEIPQFPTTENQ